jgi:hypothetical protein
MSWGLMAATAIFVALVFLWVIRTRSTHKRASQSLGPSGPPFFIEVHDRFPDADLSAHARSIFGSHAPTFRLSVQPEPMPSGHIKWRGKDHWGQPHDLHTLRAPAVLVIGKDTLPLLRDSSLWARVQDVENV